MTANEPNDQKPARRRDRIWAAIVTFFEWVEAAWDFLTELWDALTGLFVVAFYLVAPAWMFFAPPKTHDGFVFCLLILFIEAFIASIAIFIRDSAMTKLAILLVGTNALLFGFAGVYQTMAHLAAKGRSHQPCFNETHIDRSKAFYFTLGTATTAGAGQLAVVSDSCRRLASAEMVFGILAFTTALGFGVTIIASRIDADERAADDEAASATPS